MNETGAGAADPGDVYVVDNGNSEIKRYDADGGFIASFGAPGAEGGQFSFSGPTQIAVDQSDGSLYVTDTANNRIQKFAADGTFVYALGLDVQAGGGSGVEVCEIASECQAATAGAGDGELSAPQGVAVDPTDGSLLVADTANNRVQRYSSAGVYESQFGSAELSAPTRVAVDSTGRIYVLDGVASFSGRVLRYASDQGFDQVFRASPEPFVAPFIAELAVDTSNDHVLVGELELDGFNFVLTRVAELDSSGTVLDGHGAGAGFGAFFANPLTGLAANSATGRLYLDGVDLASSQSQVAILDLIPPATSARDATGIGSTSAVLRAAVNPNGLDTTYRFEYGTVDCAVGPCESTPERQLAPGSVPVPVAAQVTGLAPGTIYHFRLLAENEVGIAEGQDRTFRTLPPPGPAGLPDGRVYERVSPEEKLGFEAVSDITANSLLRARSSSDGDRVYYYTLGKFGEAVNGNRVSNLLSSRTPAGWSTRNIDTQDSRPSVGTAEGQTWDFADDLSVGVFESNAPLNPGDLDGETLLESFNFYRHDFSTTSYQLINKPDPSLPPATKGSAIFCTANRDFSHILFFSSQTLTLDDPVVGGLRLDLYEWADGEVRLVAYLPDPDGSGPLEEEPTLGNVSCGAGNGDKFYPGEHAISADGRRVFFTEPGDPIQLFNKVYLREDGTHTVEISASQRSVPDPGAPLGEFFELASADGSVAYIRSAEKLTDDATASGNALGEDLYRYDVDSGLLTDVTTQDPNGAGVLGTAGASEDGASVYFVATGVLAPGAEAGTPNLYLWREGEGVRTVATGGISQLIWTDDMENTTAGREARVSPDGRYLLFTATASLTDYDTAGHEQIYLYDSEAAGEAGALTCVSCNPTAAKSSANVSMRTREGEKQPLFLKRNLSDDGQRAFFNTPEALVADDGNGKMDVYEWEAEGSGACRTSGGCVYLISGGQSEDDSLLIDASASGDDVFFVTRQRLAGSDTDMLADVYDARVGGIAELESTPTPDCQGDSCQSAPSAPNDPSPASSAFSGAGNVGARRRQAKHGKHRHGKRKAHKRKRHGKKHASRRHG